MTPVKPAKRRKDDEIRSSDQWFAVLDTILDMALTVLVDRTAIAEYCVSQLVVYQYDNKRRGISLRYKWDDAVDLMLGFLADPTSDRFRAMALDRAYAQGIMSEFLRTLQGYCATHLAAVRDPAERMAVHQHVLSEYHNAVGLKAGRDLQQTIRCVEVLDRAASDLRNRLIATYDEYIASTARRDAESHPLNVSVVDTHQMYYLAAIKAVNHFNRDRGSFKSYLDTWIKKARNSRDHVIGSAYAPPSGVRTNHLYVPLDSVQENDMEADVAPERSKLEDGNGEWLETLGDLAALADPRGWLGQAMGLTAV